MIAFTIHQTPRRHRHSSSAPLSRTSGRAVREPPHFRKDIMHAPPTTLELSVCTTVYCCCCTWLQDVRSSRTRDDALCGIHVQTRSVWRNSPSSAADRRSASFCSTNIRRSLISSSRKDVPSDISWYFSFCGLSVSIFHVLLAVVVGGAKKQEQSRTSIQSD